MEKTERSFYKRRHVRFGKWKHEAMDIALGMAGLQHE